MISLIELLTAPLHICNFDLNRINYEEILIFFELRGVKNVNEEKFLKIFSKAFIYFIYYIYKSIC